MLTPRLALLRRMNRTGFLKRSSTAVPRGSRESLWSPARKETTRQGGADNSRSTSRWERRTNPSIYGIQRKLRRWQRFDAPRYRNRESRRRSHDTHDSRSVEELWWNTRAYAHLPIHGKVRTGASSKRDPERSSVLAEETWDYPTMAASVSVEACVLVTEAYQWRPGPKPVRRPRTCILDSGVSPTITCMGKDCTCCVLTELIVSID